MKLLKFDEIFPKITFWKTRFGNNNYLQEEKASKERYEKYHDRW